MLQVVQNLKGFQPLTTLFHSNKICPYLYTMFETAFRNELATLPDNQQLIEELVTEIVQQYSKSNRHYHNLAHLDSLYEKLLAVADKINDWQIIIFSIAYHDIVYNTLKQDNEEKSAKLAEDRLTKIGLPAAKIKACCSQILATKGHSISTDSDTNYFTDADLSILGTSEANYNQYKIAIRKEYKFYPDLLYNPGRKKVLEHFLSMSRIYKTDYFFERCEDAARANLQKELECFE